MIFDNEGNITIITQEGSSVKELVIKLEESYDRFKNDHLIVSLTSFNKIPREQIIEFLEISNRHRKTNHSFVIVTNNVNLDEIPEEITITPTLQEAYDIIEMEEMERDLGF